MCAHKVIGVSLIGLTCSAVVAGSLVQTNPGTKVISATAGDAFLSCCGIRIAANYEPRTPAQEMRLHDLVVGNWLGDDATVPIEQTRQLLIDLAGRCAPDPLGACDPDNENARDET